MGMSGKEVLFHSPTRPSVSRGRAGDQRTFLLPSSLPSLPPSLPPRPLPPHIQEEITGAELRGATPSLGGEE